MAWGDTPMRSITYSLLGLLLSVFVVAEAHGQSRRPAHRSSIQTGARSVTIVNRSAHGIIEAFASFADEQYWGDERLDGVSIPPNASRTLSLRPGPECQYELHVVYDDETSEDGVANGCKLVKMTFDGSRVSERLRDNHDVTFVNRSDQKVQSVYLDVSRNNDLAHSTQSNNWRSDRNQWRSDRLGDDWLDIGASKTFSVLGCTADIRVVYASNAAEERRSFDICRNSTVAIAPGWSSQDQIAPAPGSAPASAREAGPAADTEAAVTVVNKSGKTVMNLYLHPDREAERGHDLLGNDTLDDQATKVVKITLGSDCKFTLETSAHANDAAQTRHGVDLCAGKRITITASGRPEGTFRNAGALPVVALYIDAPDAPRGPDRLGDGVIARTGAFTLALPAEGQCDYQVTAVFRDGRTAGFRGNLCSGDDVVLN